MLVWQEWISCACKYGSESIDVVVLHDDDGAPVIVGDLFAESSFDVQTKWKM